MTEIIEIYHFVLSWMGGAKAKETPAARLGLASGKIYAKDFFASKKELDA
jgi:hypothetical protein